MAQFAAELVAGWLRNPQLIGQSREKVDCQCRIYNDVSTGSVEGIKQTLTALFASISHANYTRNEISTYEGYYASVIYAFFSSLGFDLAAEDTTSKGRIDLTVRMGNAVYIIEFKVDGKGDALQQIKQRNYQQKYLGQGKDIYLIGIDFDSAERNISCFGWERA
ncbi:MAG: PD-(D/E)XK nuclease domain-containing protein [Desulfuromonadaceae bacterium]|nr:PD-(D/E)XK nuclease domain-containing protein [Desulfuromonadaceae bacterium]